VSGPALLCGTGVFALYLVLGRLVAHAPLCALDRAGEAFIGHGVPLAVLLTSLGSFPAYVMLCCVFLLLGLLRREFLPGALMSMGTLFIAWCSSDWFKLLFARPRMEHWIVFHETSYSYASGHATLSLAFYGTWLFFIARGNGKMPLTARRVLVLILTLLILGIGWSRLALGAHYVTDVIGGYLLGAALLCTAKAVQRPMVGTWARIGGGGAAAAAAAAPPPPPAAAPPPAGGAFTME
jgi:membrane-associated phospholipid phosphatase